MKVSVFVEGGGGSKELRTRCRKGFSKLFEKAGLRGRMPKVVASGSRTDAFSDFQLAAKLRGIRGTDVAFPVLLVDSEEPIIGGGVWDHLRRRDGWEKPSQATEDHAQLMVQVMESWFLADPAALSRYFGADFLESALPKRSEIESIPKDEVLQAITKASRSTAKGSYHKGRHSFQILELVDPAELEDEARTSYAKRLLDMLRETC